MNPSPEDVTASIKPPFGKLSDEEDRRRAQASLSTALDPQGDAAPVRWENPKTGNTGSFTAVGHAYPIDARICRAFVGTMHHDGEDTPTQGTACTVAAGQWAVTDMKPLRKADPQKS